jgi:hypothetical protein
MRDARHTILEEFANAYGDAAERSRYGLIITPGDAKTSYPVAALGVVRDKRYLIVTAPQTEDHGLLAIVKGQSVTCRWFNASTAFRFRATILKLAFEPIPLVYLGLPEQVERTIVRQLPRALANLHAIVQTPEAVEALIVDLSVGGARIAVAGELDVVKGQKVELVMRPRMLERDYMVLLDCTVTTVLGRTEAQHPDVCFYSVSFQNVTDSDLLILHAYVQSCLAVESDWLSQALAHVPQ